MNNMGKIAYQRGLWAEYLGILWLLIKGYRIIAHRYRTPLGEIDIIAKKRNTLAFVEVKHRTTEAQALESLSKNQQQRPIRAASFYMAGCQKSLKPSQKTSSLEARFDILLVIPYRLIHLQNCWGH